MHLHQEDAGGTESYDWTDQNLHYIFRKRDTMKASTTERTAYAIPMTESELVDEQPRDALGRFTAKKRVVLIDEYGDMGTNKESKRWFALTAMVSDHPHELMEISQRYEPNTKGKLYSKSNELKFITSSDETRLSILTDIAKTKPSIFAIETDKWKIDPYSTWPRQGSKLYVTSAGLLMDQVAKNFNGELHVMFDKNTALQPINAVKICRQAGKKHGNQVICNDPAADSRYELLMQTNDFVTGSIGFKMNSPEKNSDRFFKVIENFTKEIRK